VRDAVVGPIYSGYSNEVSATTLANTPTDVAASDGTTNTAVHVTWSAAGGASSYAVFRASTNDSASATQIGTTTNLFYDDSAVAGDIVAYYWVKALNSVSQPGAFSNGDAGMRDTIDPSAGATSFIASALPQQITVQFSENVSNSLATGDVSVQDENNLALTPIHPAGWSYDAGTNTATFNFSSQLPDSNYRATIASGDVNDPANNPLSADVTVDFFTLSADGDHSRKVDINDFNTIAANFGKTGQTFEQGNYDYSSDGKVSIEDFNILASHFGQSMPEVQGQTAPQTQSFTVTQSSRTSLATTTSTTATATPSTDQDRLLKDSNLL
jgi:hypothetical protein